MEFVHAYLLLLAATATTLLALEKAHLSVLGVGLIVGVAIPGIVDVRQAVAGFANPAVVTVAALYVVGEAFARTGAASILTNRILARAGGGETAITATIMLLAATLSAFVNNILVVVTFMPVITSICRRTGLAPSRLLIPLSFASILGGMCTLVGTSTNLLVSGKLLDTGQEPLSMFEMTGPGLLLATVGLAYILILGRRGLPHVQSLAAQVASSSVQEYVTEVTVGANSGWIGTLPTELGIDAPARGTSNRARIAMIVRQEEVLKPPFDGIRLEAQDTLVVSGRVQHLADLHGNTKATSSGHDVPPDERYDPSSMSFFELALTPHSTMIGRRVRELELKAKHGAIVVGVMRNGSHHQQRFGDMRLRTGDVLLAFGNERARSSLRSGNEFHLIEGVDETIYRREKAGTAVAVLLTVVAAFTFLGSWVHPTTVALCGALGMVLTGCLTTRQANQAVNWPIITFVAGTIALSNGLQATEADTLLGRWLADNFEQLGPSALLAAMYLGTVMLTELLSNNAVAVIMTPVAVATATAAGVEPRSLIMAVVFAASTSFANPSAYKTNLIVYGPGGYRFVDYVRAGLGLDLLLAATAVVVLPWFFPLR